jgi:hypothetical protein
VVVPATGADTGPVVSATSVQPVGVDSGVPGRAHVGIVVEVPVERAESGGVVPGAGGGDIGGVGLAKIGRSASAPPSGRSLKVIVDLAPGMHSRVDYVQSTSRR